MRSNIKKITWNEMILFLQFMNIKLFLGKKLLMWAAKIINFSFCFQWTYVLLSINHLLTVLNSSFNFLVSSCLSFYPRSKKRLICANTLLWGCQNGPYSKTIYLQDEDPNNFIYLTYALVGTEYLNFFHKQYSDHILIKSCYYIYDAMRTPRQIQTHWPKLVERANS